MLNKCLSLSDIKWLENQKVSNGYNFKYKLNLPSLLIDIKILEKWIVPNSIKFTWIYYLTIFNSWPLLIYNKNGNLIFYYIQIW